VAGGGEEALAVAWNSSNTRVDGEDRALLTVAWQKNQNGDIVLKAIENEGT
jgi:hypothetical protein